MKQNKIKFKRAIKDNHIQYYLSVNNQINFLENSIYEEYPCYIDDESLYKLGISDFHPLNDDSLIYSLVVEYFSIEKNIYIVAPNLKDIDGTIVPMETFWMHNLKFDYRKGESKDEISEFEFSGYYELSSIKRVSICCFSKAFSSAITSFTFFIGLKDEELIKLLNNKRYKPTADRVLALCDMMITIKIVEDDEGDYNHILIQSQKDISEEIEKLEYLMEHFNQQYSKIITTIGDSADIEHNSKIYEENVAKLRNKIFDIKYKKPKEKNRLKENFMDIDWSKLSTTHGLNSAEDIPKLLKKLPSTSDELYNRITRQGDVYTASYYAILFFIKNIKETELHLMTESYDFLFEIVIGYSAYDEKVLYNNKLTALKEANYSLVFEYIELYFKDLEDTKDEELATYILDLITLFLDEKADYLDRLEDIEKNSVIKEKIEEVVFEWRNSEKVKVLSSILNTYHDKKDYQKVLKDGLKYFSDHTGCIEELKVTQKLLDRLYDMKIITSEMYRACIEQSACGRWDLN
ncbi:MAG TPA: hypothetical protein EYG83_08865 [Sulfurospirillum arcachonense]|nr:hypothetical protein [Sulfurospirillum arcachonense]